MIIAAASTSTQEGPISPEMALFRLTQALEDCQYKAADLSSMLYSSNLRGGDFKGWEDPIRVSKELLELLKNLDLVNDIVISKDALKPEQKSVKEALRLSLESFCNLHASCQHSKKISEGIFDSSTAVLRILENSLVLLLQEFVDRLAVRES